MNFTVFTTAIGGQYKHFFSGSLSHFYCDSIGLDIGNYISLDAKKCKEAIELLCSTLGIEKDEAVVTGFEVGVEVSMRREASSYLAVIKGCHPKHRREYPYVSRFKDETVYFHHSGKNGIHTHSFVLYDKVAEMNKHHRDVVDGHNHQLIKAELRMKDRLKEKLGLDENPTLRTFSEEEFLSSLTQQFISHVNGLYGLKGTVKECSASSYPEMKKLFFGWLSLFTETSLRSVINSMFPMVDKKLKSKLKIEVESFAKQYDSMNQAGDLLQELKESLISAVL